MCISEPTLGMGGVSCTLPAAFRMLLPPEPEDNSGCCGQEWRRPLLGPEGWGQPGEQREGPREGSGVPAAAAAPLAPPTQWLPDFLGGKEGRFKRGLTWGMAKARAQNQGAQVTNPIHQQFLHTLNPPSVAQPASSLGGTQPPFSLPKFSTSYSAFQFGVQVCFPKGTVRMPGPERDLLPLPVQQLPGWPSGLSNLRRSSGLAACREGS